MNEQRKRKIGWTLAAFAAVLVLAVAVGQWNRWKTEQRPYTSTEFAMGSYVQQTVYGNNGEEAASEAANAVQRLENRISWRIEDSDVARLNEAAGTDWIAIDPQTTELLAQALEVAERSDGAYDPTILPVSSLWDFGGENQHLPEPEQIEEYRSYVGYQNLRVDEEMSEASLKIHGAAVDLGGIGKGAACDVAVQIYQETGVAAGVIAVGGSIGLYGEKPDGSLWRLGVRDPKSGDDKTEAMGLLDLASGFVSTSGSYEKTFTENGKTYHHLLDPKTGYPAESGLVSVTVVAENGALSDALATAVFVLGEEKGMALLDAYGAGGILISQDDRVWVSDSLKDAFQLTSDTYTLVS